MLENWSDVIKIFGILSILLLAATFVKAKIKFFQNYFIPNSIIAGFMGLILGPQVLHLFHMSPDIIKNYLYHLLGITFIALSLQKTEKIKGRESIKTAFVFALGYGMQAFIGLGLTLFILNKFFPLFHPANGLLVQLGFSNSPAVASNIAEGWRTILSNSPGISTDMINKSGIQYASDIGLIFGAIGFLISCICGVLLIKYGVKKEYIRSFKKTSPEIANGDLLYNNNKQQEFLNSNTTKNESIDSLTFHVAMILSIYITTYFLLKLILFLMGFLPEQINFFAKVIINFHFIFGAFIAIIVKKTIHFFNLDFLIDDYFLKRLTGISVDYMTAAAISAISLTIVIQFIFPILIISSITGVLTFLLFAFLGSRSFVNYQYERVVTLFCIATGSMATGMAMLRVMDPDYQSSIAKDIMVGSGLVFFFTMPIMVLINLPMRAIITNNPAINWLALAFTGLFVLILILIWSLTGLLKFTGLKLWNIK